MDINIKKSSLFNGTEDNKKIIYPKTSADQVQISDTENLSDKLQNVDESISNLSTSKVDNVDGKGLSTNDYTNEEKQKLSTISNNAKDNVLEAIKVNGVEQTISNKSVNISVPTTAADIGALPNSTTHLSGDIATTEKGVAGGVATLGSDGKVPNSQLPEISSGSGTITEIRMNGESKGTSGVVDLGTVITEHQDISGKISTSLKGTANGVAELNSNGKVPSSQLPSYVDDVIEGYLYNGNFYKETAHSTQITGESGKIYIDLHTEKTYRWSGSAFVIVSETIALGETSSTAYRGDRGKIAYDHSQSAHAPSNAEENQNTFSNIVVGSTTIAADSKSDTLTLVAGANVTITPDATNDKVTIAATDTTYSAISTTFIDSLFEDDYEFSADA